MYVNKQLVKTVSSLLIIVAHTFSVAQIAFAASGQLKAGKDLFEARAKMRLNEADSPSNPEEIEGDTLELVKMLGIAGDIEQLKSKGKSAERDDKLDALILRSKISRALQYASLELEECLANIDGDLASTNMQYSFFAAKHDRSIMLNNIAAFASSGTLGVMDSATSIKYPPPLANIYGITGNSLAVAIPLLGLIPPRYKNPQGGEHVGNMLARIFNQDYESSGYDQIIWEYINKTPAHAQDKLSRRQALLKTWESYRGIKADRDKKLIAQLTDTASKDSTVSLDLLKTRAELLVELRALVQGMYKDISDLNTALMRL